jgi:hypothetical protein
LRPGQEATWDLRLRNVGNTQWVMTGVVLDIHQTSNPTGSCDPTALNPRGVNAGGTESAYGVFILGKNGDPINDNPRTSTQLAFANETVNDLRVIRVAPGDYEDVRLRVLLDGTLGLGCSGAQWSVSWTFTVG